MLKVSVIIPVYGVEQYIEKCARSVFEQTYSDLEILFVNDCTPDNSIRIIQRVLEEYPVRKDQVQIVSQEKNKGVSAARKKGLELATGDYCIQFDSDDYVASTMIEELVGVAEEKDADIVMCDFNLIKGEMISHIHANPCLDPIQCLMQSLRGELHSSLCNKLIRVCLYSNHRIQFTEGLDMREDLSVIYRLLFYAKRLAYIPRPFYNYILRQGSVSAARMNDKQQRNAQDLIEQMNQFCVLEHIQDRDLLDAFSYFKAQIKTYILLFGNKKEMREELFEDVRFRHFATHPMLSFSHKLMGVMASMGLKPLVWMYRKLIDCALNFKH